MQKYLILVTLLFPLSSNANDSTATIAAGGIEFKKHTEIQMKNEILEISREKIKISYDFLNHSDQSISETISFPLPEIRDEQFEYYHLDPLYQVYRLIESSTLVSDQAIENFHLDGGNPAELLKPQDARMTVQSNGKKITPHMAYLAKLPDGKNISKDLLEMGIPVSKAYLTGWESSSALQRHPAWLEKLKQQKLLDAQNRPAWTNQVIYLWQDTFAPGKNHHVDHEYTPSAGYGVVQFKSDPSHPDQMSQFKMMTSTYRWEDYCPTAQTVSKLKKLLNKDKILNAHEVRYVLKTGANWAGPIESFQLNIHPPKNGFALFCWKGKAAYQNSIKEKNFTPTEDLAVLFLSPDPY